jgi:hypothetical protein
MTDYEWVEHPTHYNRRGGIECKDFAQWFPGNLYVAIKHLWRCGLKPSSDPVEDLRKAKEYIRFEIARLSDYPSVNYGHLPAIPDDINTDALWDAFGGKVAAAMRRIYNAVFDDKHDSDIWLETAIDAIDAEIARLGGES